MKLTLMLVESPMPTEPGYYVCSCPTATVKSIVEIKLHPQDNVPVIYQIGTGRVFIQEPQDKGFFWSERIEI